MSKPLIWSVRTDFDKQLPYYFTIVGTCYEQEHVKRPKGYPYFQWIQCREGRGELTLSDNKKFIISKGRGMLLFPNEPHEYKALDEEWLVDLAVFTGAEVEGFIRRIVKVDASGAFDVASPQIIAGVIEELYAVAGTALPTGNLRCSALIYTLLTELSRLLSTGQASPMIRLLDRVRPAISQIENAPERPFSLGELTTLVGVTPQYFCSLFKQATSQTPVEYVNLVRLRRAKELLLQTSLSVKEIASRVGVEDASYFCSLFRRYEHMTPLAFRTLQGEG